jgi:hypothetical protein
MSQVDFLRGLDADIVGSLRDAGMADIATYTPPEAGSPVHGVDALVDRAVAFYGTDGATVAGYRNVVTLFKDQVADPQRGGTVTVGSEVFTLDELDAHDESMSRWVVIDG